MAKPQLSADINSAPKTISVLQVEDNPGDRSMLKSLLQHIPSYNFDLEYASTLEKANQWLKQSSADIIFLDLGLPDGGGLESLKNICRVAPETPVVLLTASEDTDVVMQAIECGAQDYISKDQISEGVLARVIRYAIDRKQIELKLTRLTRYDVLTGLVNRDLFHSRLNQAMQHVKHNNGMLALLFLDLDHFKTINDQFGHDYGDMLLQCLAERLKACVRVQDTVARLGGDEFTVILEDIPDQATAVGIARKIIQTIAQPVMLRDRQTHTSTSVGIAVYSGGESCNPEELLRQADTAMYRAKQQGRNELRCFDGTADPGLKPRLEIETALQKALEREEFFLEYQPQIDISNNRLIGAEVLLRWRREDGTVELPDTFIGLLEHMGLIIPVGEWIMYSACRQWAEWAAAGYVDEDSSVSINFSASQFWQQNLITIVSNVLADTGLSAHQLSLELTESILLSQDELNMQILRSLKELGVRLSIDDFGSKFSTLNYLKHFLIDRLKVDRHYVKDILTNREDAAVAAAVIGLANNLLLEVVAEGVDSLEKIDLLRQYGCHIFQGYYFSEPLSPEQLIRRYGEN